MSGILPGIRGNAGAPNAASFDPLPRDQARDSQNQLPHPCNQREREGGVARNAKQITNEYVAALLHAKRARHREHCRANCQDHTLQDERVDERRPQIQRVKREFSA